MTIPLTKWLTLAFTVPITRKPILIRKGGKRETKNKSNQNERR